MQRAGNIIIITTNIGDHDHKHIIDYNKIHVWMLHSNKKNIMNPEQGLSDEESFNL